MRMNIRLWRWDWPKSTDIWSRFKDRLDIDDDKIMIRSNYF